MAFSPKILFVGIANVVHTHKWMELLAGEPFQVRHFAPPVSFAALYDPLPWTFPTYSLQQPHGLPLPFSAP